VNERERQNSLLDQVMAEQEAKSMPQTAEMRGSTDDEFVGVIKSQSNFLLTQLERTSRPSERVCNR
jgi:hypothetical protein